MHTLFPHFLSGQILRLLFERPGLTAEQLRNAVAGKAGRAPTIQGIYKELRRLQTQLVVMKSRNKFYMSLPYLLSARASIEEAVAAHTGPAVLKNFLPEPGGQENWRFSDLHAMDRLVVNLIVTLLRTGRDKNIYYWDPYPWYAVFHADLAAPFLKEFAREGYRAFGIIGARSPISEYVRDSQRKFRHHWWIGDPPFEVREDTYIVVKPPFILSIKHPPESIEVFRELFKSPTVRSAAEFAPFHDLHFKNLSYAVRLRNSEAQSQRLVAAYGKVFTVSRCG